MGPSLKRDHFKLGVLSFSYLCIRGHDGVSPRHDSLRRLAGAALLVEGLDEEDVLGVGLELLEGDGRGGGLYGHV